MKNYNLKKIILIAIAAIIFLILGTLLFNELFFKHEEGLVFITNTGDRYHNINCSYLLSMNPIGIEQAKARGYTACARCGGVATGRIEVNNYWASFAIAVAVLLLLCFIIFIISSKHEEKRSIPSQSDNVNAISLNRINKETQSLNTKISEVPPREQHSYTYLPIDFEDKAISYEDFQGDIRYFIVSDICGSYKRLMRALNWRNFNKHNFKHILVLCGDVLGHSDDIIALEDFLCELNEQHRLIYIRGDIDYQMLDLINQIQDAKSSLNNPIGDDDSFYTREDEEESWLSLYESSICAAGDLLEKEPIYFWHNKKDLVEELVETPLIQLMIEDSYDYFEIENYIVVHGWIPNNANKSEHFNPDWKYASRSEWENATTQYDQGIDVPGKIVICAQHMTMREAMMCYDHVTFPETYPYFSSNQILLQSWNYTNCMVLQQDLNYKVNLLYGKVYIGAFWICEDKVIFYKSLVDIDKNSDNPEIFRFKNIESIWKTVSEQKYKGKFHSYTYDYFPHGIVEYDIQKHNTIITLCKFKIGKFMRKLIPAGTLITYDDGRFSPDLSSYINYLMPIFRFQSVEYIYESEDK